MNNEQLKNEIKDLLNQVMIKLQDVELPEVDEEYDEYGYSNIPVSFKNSYQHNQLPSIKAVCSALLDDLEKNNKYYSDAEKLARSYYSSFCNG